MIELPQYAESLHQPIPVLEELVIRIQAVFQPFVDALIQVAQAIVKAFRPLLELFKPARSPQERRFLAVVHRGDLRSRTRPRAHSRRYSTQRK